MYAVIELQKNTDGTLGNIIQPHESYEQALSSYFTILAAAVVSDVPVHSATLLRDDGFALDYRSFEHIQEHEQ